MSVHPTLDNSPLIALIPEAKAAVIRKAAALYDAMAPQAALSSKATFSLLSSLALIGISFASAKPNTVQVLGFTIQADHWIYMAGPLALIVCYSVALLTLAWRVEERRYKYFVIPLQLDLLLTLRSLLDAYLKQNSPQATMETLAPILESHNREASDAALELDAKLSALNEEEYEMRERIQQKEDDLQRAYSSGALNLDDLLRETRSAQEELSTLGRRRMEVRMDHRQSTSTSVNRLNEASREEVKRLADTQERELPYFRKMSEEALLTTRLSGRMIKLGYVFPAALALIACGIFLYMAFKS
jgi:hypothetical protein